MAVFTMCNSVQIILCINSVLIMAVFTIRNSIQIILCINSVLIMAVFTMCNSVVWSNCLTLTCNGGKLEMVNILLTASMEQTRFITKKKFQNDCQVFINAKSRPKVISYPHAGCGDWFKNYQYSVEPNIF